MCEEWKINVSKFCIWVSPEACCEKNDLFYFWIYDIFVEMKEITETEIKICNLGEIESW